MSSLGFLRMHHTARWSLGCWICLLAGCSTDDVETAATTPSGHAGTAAQATRGGSSSATAAGTSTVGGSATASTAASGGTPLATSTSAGSAALEPELESAGAAGARYGNSDAAGAAGWSAAGGTTAASGGMSAGTSAANPGTGGAASTTATLQQVLATFCALQDVLACTPDCLVTRQDEAQYFPNCREAFRIMMSCQLALPAALRKCQARTVTTPNDCASESEAYWICTGALPAT